MGPLSARGLTAVVVFVAVFALHLVCIPFQGLTDDDDFYAPAGIRYAGWLVDVVTDPTAALSQERIDAAFTVNHEHPPLAKMVFGLSQLVFHEGLGWLGVLDGARAGNALLVALTCAVLILWLWRSVGVVAALASVALLLSLPRFFFHSEVATLDVPVACLIVMVCACFTAAGDRRFAGLVVGVVFGLACLTKLNAPFAALPCALLVLCERWRGFGVSGTRTRRAGAPDVPDAAPHDDDDALPSLRLPSLPPSLWAMALIGPLMFVVGWPWLWHDTGARLGGYLAFHLRHYPIFLFFDGEIWNEPFAPGRAAVVMAVATQPIVVVALGGLGSLFATVSLSRLIRSGRDQTATSATTEPTPEPTPEHGALRSRDRVMALCLMQALLSVGVVALSDVPRYGGEKLFMPFFPFWCVLAGKGVAVVVEAVCHFVDDGVAGRRARFMVPLLIIGLSVAPGFAGTARFFGGYALSYYGELTGGLRGAVSRGYERTYYDVADKTLARFLDQRPPGSKVHFEPNHKEYARTYRWLKKDGVISRQGVTLVDRLEAADVVVLTHERRWSTYPALRERLRDRPVLFEKRIDGVPLYTVYAGR